MNDEERALRRKTHQTIGKISDDIGRRHHFNTAIAAAMELLNALLRFNADTEQGRAVVREAVNAVVVMLSPMVPHICHVLWGMLGHDSAVIDAALAGSRRETRSKLDALDLVVQVNGKLRGRISVPNSAGREEIEQAALTEENVVRFIDGQPIRKVIVVPGRLVNVVV